MNFNLSEEQTMIQDSIARFVQDTYAFDQRNAAVALPAWFQCEQLAAVCGAGLAVHSLCRGLRRFWRRPGGYHGHHAGVWPRPGGGAFPAYRLLFGGLLQAGASEELKSELIPQIVAGELQGAFAFVERQSRYAITDVKTRARQEGVNWVLSGEKTVVLNGGAAEKLVVLARSSGEQSDENGLSLFLVDSYRSGVETTSYRMTDGREAANIVWIMSPPRRLSVGRERAMPHEPVY